MLRGHSIERSKCLVTENRKIDNKNQLTSNRFLLHKMSFALAKAHGASQDSLVVFGHIDNNRMRSVRVNLSGVRSFLFQNVTGELYHSRLKPQANP